MKKICPIHGIYRGKRCPECIAEKNKTYDIIKRNAKAAKFYSSEQWKKVKIMAMKRSGGLCMQCKAEGRITKADVVDHIIPIEVDWNKRLRLDNLQPLCHNCHNKKHNKIKKLGEGRVRNV